VCLARDEDVALNLRSLRGTMATECACAPNVSTPCAGVLNSLLQRSCEVRRKNALLALAPYLFRLRRRRWRF